MNPILMTLANDNAKKLADLAMDGKGLRLPLAVVDFDAALAAVVAWIAALRTTLRRVA